MCQSIEFLSISWFSVLTHPSLHLAVDPVNTASLYSLLFFTHCNIRPLLVFSPCSCMARLAVSFSSSSLSLSFSHNDKAQCLESFPHTRQSSSCGVTRSLPGRRSCYPIPAFDEFVQTFPRPIAVHACMHYLLSKRKSLSPVCM